MLNVHSKLRQQRQGLWVCGCAHALHIVLIMLRVFDAPLHL
jgi:hypothetical protein